MDTQKLTNTGEKAFDEKAGNSLSDLAAVLEIRRGVSLSVQDVCVELDMVVRRNFVDIFASQHPKWLDHSAEDGRLLMTWSRPEQCMKNGQHVSVRAASPIFFKKLVELCAREFPPFPGEATG